MTSSRKKTHKGKRSASWKYILFALLGIGLIGAYFVFGPNTGSFTKGEYLYIRTGSGYEEVKRALKEGGFVRDFTSFDLLAKQANYPALVKPGRYHISKGMSNYKMVRLLRSGKQSPVKLVIRKVRTKDEFIRLVSANLEAGSSVLQQMLADPVYLAQFGLDTSTALCAVMPDTYEFYWNTSTDKVFRKIEKNYARFWTEGRKQQAKARNLTPAQAVILASIVEEETNNNSEKGNIASVYLNRLEKGMRLQADPTAKYAYGDFALRRITAAQTGLASPYNTYYVTGLPIGPICTPYPNTINAVLQSPKTTYLYFCAREDGRGHRFATTYNEHLKNRALYIQGLNARGIH